MNWNSVVLFGLMLVTVVVLKGYNCQTNAESPDYVVAVVEYHMNETGATEQDRLNARVQDYVNIIRSHAAMDADIIVFPEAPINSVQTAQTIPEPGDMIRLCGNDTHAGDAIHAISCAAIDTMKYVIINLIMVRQCQTCPTGTIFFNTNVVFNQGGQVISIYRKFNLFDEQPGVVAPPAPDISFFSTDFGVRIGHMASADLILERPARDLLAMNIVNFIVPTRWQSTLPFLTAIQVQEGWAFANNVNLIVAGLHQPLFGASGSGIYSGQQGALRSIISDMHQSVILVSRLSRVPGKNPEFHRQVHPIMPPSIILIRDNLNDYQFTPIAPNPVEQTHSSCSNSFCCTYNFTMTDNGVTNSQFYTYVSATFNGIRRTGNFADGHIRTCSIIACLDNTNPNTCGITFPPNSTINHRFRFSRILITGEFRVVNALTMPSTVRTNLMPLNINVIGYDVSEAFNVNGVSHRNVTIGSGQGNEQEHLLTFGIYSRQFENSASTLSKMSVTLLIIFILLVNVGKYF